MFILEYDSSITATLNQANEHDLPNAPVYVHATSHSRGNINRFHVSIMFAVGGAGISILALALLAQQKVLSMPPAAMYSLYGVGGATILGDIIYIIIMNHGYRDDRGALDDLHRNLWEKEPDSEKTNCLKEMNRKMTEAISLNQKKDIPSKFFCVTDPLYHNRDYVRSGYRSRDIYLILHGTDTSRRADIYQWSVDYQEKLEALKADGYSQL